MVKKYAAILLLIVLFIFIKPVSAAPEAGSSARLASSLNDTQRIDVYTQGMSKKLTIARILRQYHSPLITEIDAFMEACTTYELDCYLLPSITGLESSFGQYIAPGTYNPFGWGGGYTMFDSWADGIMTVGKGLRENYINQGLLTIDQIGPKYAESPTWTLRVGSISNKLHTMEQKHAYRATIIALE